MTEHTPIERLVERLEELRLFLSGQGPLDGLHFGDHRLVTKTRTGAFWWRGAMSETLVAVARELQQAQGRIVELEEQIRVHSGPDRLGEEERQSSTEPSAAEACLLVVRSFVEGQSITCSETIYQTDRVIENASEFIERLCDIAGYAEHEQ